MSAATTAKLPPTIAVVVQSDVLGSIAFSIPAHEYRVQGDQGGKRFLAVEVADIEDELERRETSYLDSHVAPEREVETVDNTALRAVAKRMVDSGLETWDGIAERIGWWREANDRPEGKRPDGERVRYTLGLTGKPKADPIPYDVAVELTEGLGLDPVDVGL